MGFPLNYMNFNFVDSWVAGLTGAPMTMLMTCAAAFAVAVVLSGRPGERTSRH